MKILKSHWLFITFAALVGSMMTVRANADVTTVPFVDLSRYIGTWHEIASIPQKFQRQCVRNTRAEYAEGENNTIAVLNSCETKTGERSNAEGHAFVVDTKTNAKLKVSFVKVLGQWIYAFGGDYWVIDLHPEYQYAVVGHPNRTYGWILSRTSSLSNQDMKQIASNLTKQGYDLCAFKMTRQDGGFDGEQTRFCDYVAQP